MPKRKRDGGSPSHFTIAGNRAKDYTSRWLSAAKKGSEARPFEERPERVRAPAQKGDRGIKRRYRPSIKGEGTNIGGEVTENVTAFMCGRELSAYEHVNRKEETGGGKLAE